MTISDVIGEVALAQGPSGQVQAFHSPLSGIPFVLPFPVPSKLTAASSIQQGSAFIYPVVVPVNLAGSSFTATTAATSTAVFTLTILRGFGIIQLATLTFAAGATSATFVAPATTNLAAGSTGTPAAANLLPGDVLNLNFPAIADATLAGVALNLAVAYL